MKDVASKMSCFCCWFKKPENRNFNKVLNALKGSAIYADMVSASKKFRKLVNICLHYKRTVPCDDVFIILDQTRMY